MPGIRSWQNPSLQKRERALRLMFSETECIERRDFTMLHKVILGLASSDLGQLLSDSTVDLNTLDNNGRSPVSLAAERGDLEALSTLLRYNPDVNISCTSGSSPLHFASCAQNPSCMKPLLGAGAIVDSFTNWNQTPLIYAAAYVKSAANAEILLDSGAKIDWRDRDGITALSWTAIANNIPVAEVLIRRGADVNNIDRGGDTFATLCVTNNQTELLRLLIGHEIIFNTTVPSKSLLVLMAQHATIETMQILSELIFEDIGVSAKENDGSEWNDILDARLDCDEDLKKASRRFMKRIRGTTRNSAQFDTDRTGNEETFEDALEHQ